MKRGEILDAVKQTITKDRNDRHGEPENSFPRIADAWTDYLQRILPTRETMELKPSDVAEMLAIFKTCRFETQPDNPDNEHDRIGYYAIAAELRAAERAEKSVLVASVRDPATVYTVDRFGKTFPVTFQPARRRFKAINEFPAAPNYPGENIEYQKHESLIPEILSWQDGKWLPSKDYDWKSDQPPQEKPETPNTPNRKPAFEGETFAGKLASGLAVEWTGVANMHGELLWHRTK